MSNKPVYPGWCIHNASKDATSCILALPGRGQSGFQIAGWYHSLGLARTTVIGITPVDREWYPMPNGPSDQREAVAGVYQAIASLRDIVNDIHDFFGFEQHQIAIVGFSAGAVMGIQLAAHSRTEFAGVVGHGGAILEPRFLPDCQNSTPYLTTHNMDDDTFEWVERYLPMKKVFRRKRYAASFAERLKGNHKVYMDDLLLAVDFFGERLGYTRQELNAMFGPKIEKAKKGVWLSKT